jgi:hypothetical protein
MQTLQDERREVLESVLDALAIPEPDTERSEVCLSLLRHLMDQPRTAGGSYYGAD